MHYNHFGRNSRERHALLKGARTWARILDVIGFATFVWALFYPRPYQFAVGASLLVPLLIILSLRFFPGALRFDGNAQSAYPTVARAFLLPVLAVALRALVDFEILAWDAFWLPFALISAGVFALLLLHAEDVRTSLATAFLTLLFCLVFGAGATVMLNGMLDRSTPQVYSTEVAAKRVSTGKGRSYSLILAPWGPEGRTSQVRVSASVYLEKREGDPVLVYVRTGALGIPWFFLR